MPLTFCTFARKAFCWMLCDCLPPLVNYSRERSRKSASSVHPHVKMINKIMVLDLRILTVYWLWSKYTAYKLYFCQIKWICYIFYKENLSCVQLHCCLYAFLYMYHMLNDKVRWWQWRWMWWWWCWLWWWWWIWRWKWWWWWWWWWRRRWLWNDSDVKFSVSSFNRTEYYIHRDCVAGFTRTGRWGRSLTLCHPAILGDARRNGGRRESSHPWNSRS